MKRKKTGIILLIIVALCIFDRCSSYIRTTQLKYLAENPESKNYIVKQLTTDQMIDLWFNEQDSLCFIKTGNFDYETGYSYNNIKYWIINANGQLLSVLEEPEEINKIQDIINSFSFTNCFQKSWYTIKGVSYQEDNPDQSSIPRIGYHREGLVYRHLFDVSLNPTGHYSGNYWGATAFFKMKHNGETIHFKEYGTLSGLISFSNASASIKLYCPTGKTKIISLEYLSTNSSFRRYNETFKYDRPDKNRGVYVVVKK